MEPVGAQEVQLVDELDFEASVEANERLEPRRCRRHPIAEHEHGFACGARVDLEVVVECDGRDEVDHLNDGENVEEGQKFHVECSRYFLERLARIDPYAK